MERYTIYCTPEQTRKALQLCAPIDKVPISGRENRPCFFTKSPDEEGWNDCDAYYCPTAEQMIGWLEDKFLNEIHIEQDANGGWLYFIYNGCNVDVTESFDTMHTRKEATIAAIDAALEYLSTK